MPDLTKLLTRLRRHQLLATSLLAIVLAFATVYLLGEIRGLPQAIVKLHERVQSLELQNEHYRKVHGYVETEVTE